MAKHILTDTRKNTSPMLFEALIFLKVNRSLWDATTVGKAMGRTQEQHKNAVMINYIDIDESTTDTSGGGASEITNSTIAEAVGAVNDDDDDDEYYDMAYF